MTRAVLSLGSNLGDRLAFLRIAADGFAEELVAASPVYETVPWGVTEQPKFLNAVLLVESDEFDEWDWLRKGQSLERAAERIRERRWGPRTLDVDVVTVDEVRSDHPELTLPHPGTASRASVLVPWLAMDPEAVLPGRGWIGELLEALTDAEKSGVRERPEFSLR